MDLLLDETETELNDDVYEDENEDSALTKAQKRLLGRRRLEQYQEEKLLRRHLKEVWYDEEEFA